MIKSMTGYASESFFVESTKYIVEAKSVNSKILDLKIRLPQFLKAKEFDIRKFISSKLLRGKIEVIISHENNLGSQKININSGVVNEYIKELKDINKNLDGDYLNIAMQLPNAYDSALSSLEENQIVEIEKTIEKTIEKLDNYRLKEGKETEKDLIQKISIINSLLVDIENVEKTRLDNKKGKLLNEFNKLNIEIDQNRLEQEMIYYIEKFDINEELIRLKSHIKLFMETLESKSPVGKKLGFICQEIGREINTIGSKSNDSSLQKYVIEMKDNLEKIKENILNIL